MILKRILFFLSLLPIMAFSQDDYEEKAYLGMHFEYTRFTDIEFTYLETPSPFDNGIVAKYKLASDPEVTPLIGLAGNLPFLFNPYFNATMVAGFQKATYKLTSSDPRAIEEGTNKKTLETYTVVVEGGPELGYPFIADPVKDEILKLFVFGQVIIGKTFLNEAANIKNDAYFGYNYGGGLRYGIGRFAIGAGVKNSEWIWKPLFDDSKGYNIDESQGKDKVNRVRIRFSQFIDPYIDIKYSIF